MRGLTKADMNGIYAQLSQSRKVDHRVEELKHSMGSENIGQQHFFLSKRDKSAPCSLGQL
jgi:hypothetical protein